MSPTMTVVLPWMSFASTPILMAFQTVQSVAKANSSPTPVRTDPSISPEGGTTKPAMMRPMEMQRQI